MLHESVRLWIDRQGWQSFTNIQSLAIPKILNGTELLIVAPTASGKTESVLLPILSRIIEERFAPVSLLYIAPMRALINDQQLRAELLLREMPLVNAWWHSDLPPHKRKALISNPPDVLLTTPESLEVHLSSEAYQHGAFFGNVRYVVIDEIHAFAGDDRGAQLVSLLNRLETLMHRPFKRYALSATIGQPERVASWLSSSTKGSSQMEVLVDVSSKGRRLGVGYLKPPADEETKEQKEMREKNAAVRALIAHTTNRRSIVFVNSRRDAEYYTTKLNDANIEAFVHHGSLSPEMRKIAESKFKIDGAKTIVASASLELGIDIGDLEQVVQIGALGTSSSWLQRIGRSGRKAGVESVGYIYARDADELPICVALCDLASEGVAEELVPNRANIGVAFHQLINLVRERDRIHQNEAIATLRVSGSFCEITDQEWEDLVSELIADAFLENINGLLQLGPAAEKTFGRENYKAFYAVFSDEVGWTVKNGNQVIGQLDKSFVVSENRKTTFVLAGRWWKVVSIESTQRILQVEKVSKGDLPKWLGTGGGFSYEVMQRTADILNGRDSAFITKSIEDAMSQMRNEAKEHGIRSNAFVVGQTEDQIYVHTYIGTRLNSYFGAMLGMIAEAKSNVGATHFALTGGNFGLSQTVDCIKNLMSNPSYRHEQENRLSLTSKVPGQSKYWVYFGPKTRANILRRQFSIESDVKKLQHFEIIVSGRIVESQTETSHVEAVENLKHTEPHPLDERSVSA